MSAFPDDDRPSAPVIQGVAPPHSVEAEQSVLGAMLLSDETHYQYVIEEGLKAADFYVPRHRVIYDAMSELYGQSQPIDFVTLAEHLRSTGRLEDAGGAAEVDALAAVVPVVGHIRRYAAIVKDRALLRRVLDASYRIQAAVHNHDGEPRDIVEQAEKAMLEVARDDRQKDFRAVGDVLHREIDVWQKLATEGVTLTGTPSGFRELDEMTGGFQPGNLVIIAARPSMGKSALVTNIAENVALHRQRPRPVALFSLEMSEAELAKRFIASQAGIKGDDLSKGRLRDERKWKRVLETAGRYDAAPLYVDDSSDVGLMDVRAKARRLHQSTYDEYGGLGLIIVDYLQLMRADARTESRVLQIGEMSRGLKILARELEVPVIALSQLSRAVESRTDKRPMLSDLRESGCLTGETLVHLPRTGERVPIAELCGTAPFTVLALDPSDWRLREATATRAFCTGTKPVHELRTRLGRTIRATANHRFLTFSGWKRLDELRPDDHLALPRHLPQPATAHDLPEARLALLGHLIGDGCTLPRHAIQVTTKERELADVICALATEAFGDAVAPHVRAERSWLQVHLTAREHLTHGRRNPVAAWLDALGAFGLRSHEKHVPEAVRRGTDAGIATFLRHLWSTDGCVWTSPDGARHRVYYATSSPRLAQDVQHLLLRLGISATRRRVGSSGQPHFSVDVSGHDDLLRFVELVGAVGTRREAACERLGRAVASRAANTNRDVIPKAAWRTIVQPAMAAAGVTTRGLQDAIGTSYCGSTLYRSNLSRPRAARVAEAARSPELARLAASDVVWDRVASIESAGIEPVYDLTVPGLHNFVAGDVVVHNSIEQDADLVMFIFRDEYYTQENSERPGEADLIVAKNRQGAVGDVPLNFQAEYPRFMDLQRAA